MNIYKYSETTEHIQAMKTASSERKQKQATANCSKSLQQTAQVDTS